MTATVHAHMNNSTWYGGVKVGLTRQGIVSGDCVCEGGYVVVSRISFSLLVES